MAEDYLGWNVIISDDSMRAQLHMEPPVDRNPYTVDEAIAFIKSRGVVSGIIYSAVEEMVELRQYYKDVEIAQGRDPVDGINGEYEFFFDLGVIKKPMIRSDGSVDYSSMTVVHSVRAGDKLAVYHPAKPGTHGYDVKGREMRCKPGKDLPVIRGKGFETDYAGTTYTASVEGRVDYKDYKLNIYDEYELRGDLDLVTGRIDFRGDVVVRGNVRSGTLIRATKSITIEGSVEGATLISEGDIVLKKGMQGGNKAKIICGGDLYANFIEFADVSVKGNLEANIIMNCRVAVGKCLTVSGKRGMIVGGNVYSVGGITSSILGNAAEARTLACTGVSEELEKRNHSLNVKADISKNRIKKAQAELASVTDARICLDSPEVKAAKANQIKRYIKRDERLLEHVNAELAEIEETMKLGRDATILISNKVNAGSVIRIADRELEIKNATNGVRFYRPDAMSDIMTQPV